MNIEYLAIPLLGYKFDTDHKVVIAPLQYELIQAVITSKQETK